MTGFEPVTPCSQNRYSTKLSHIPIMYKNCKQINKTFLGNNFSYSLQFPNNTRN